MFKRAVITAALIGPLSACANLDNLRPDYVAVYAKHESQPGHGIGPAPIGGPGPETNYDGLGVSVRWERGRYFSESELTYAVHSSNLTGGPWVFSARAGLRFRVGQ